MQRSNRRFPLRAALLVATGLLAPTACGESATYPDSTRWTGPVSSRTYREGSRVYLEVVAGPDTARVALEERWGAAIVEASLNGTNFVNAFDPGREIQMSLYDGDHLYDTCAGCRGVWGWNPVQAGDRLGNGSSVLETVLGGDHLRVRVRPNHWYPDNKGGGWGRPVGADVVVTQRISSVPGHPRAFHIEYAVEHSGSDRHAPTAQQEFPAIYVNREFERFVHYDGIRPWTGAPTRITGLPPLFKQSGRRVHASEWWAAFVDSRHRGIAVYTPGSFPYFTSGFQSGGTGPTGSGANYTHPYTPFGLAPRSTITGDVYVLLGELDASRRSIYDIHRAGRVRDVAVPMGDFSLSHSLATVGDEIVVTGWGYDNAGPPQVRVLLNDSTLGVAPLNRPRPEVRRDWPGAPLDAGFEYRLSTRTLPTGPHTVRVQWVDAAGHTLERTLPFRLWN